MRPDPRHLIIIAGEASSDLHGASLARALRCVRPDLRISGIGGTHMRHAAVDVWDDLTGQSVIGFVEILRHLQTYRRVFHTVLQRVREQPPAALILIDFPGFNLRLANAVKKHAPCVKIIYYISPQVWAWGQHRVELIRRVVDKMIVIFKFEQEFYRRRGIPTDYVGHPLLDEVRSVAPRERIRNDLGCAAQEPLIALLPGSRDGELQRHLPLMLAAACLLGRAFPHARFALVKAENLNAALYEKHLRKYPRARFPLIAAERHAVIAASDFAWVCSGTATLETAILATPMIVVYRTSLITWLISRALISVPHIGLVNVVAGEKIVPELIQFRAVPRHLARTTADFLRLPHHEQQKKRAQLSAVRAKLEPGNAASRAAQTIVTFVS